ncbi:MAG: hypothetical protein GX456_01050 [Verrucomicrobia bacterium]|nr:hypothetical protein [Verrucomicrobiota bacterium]
MALISHIKWFPSAAFIATVLLGAYYRLAYQPLVRASAAQDKELVTLWGRLVSSNEQVRACRGLSIENHNERVMELNGALANLDRAQELIKQRIEIGVATRAKMEQPWQLIDFQIERLQQAGALLRIAKENRVTVEAAALAGLPEYSVDLPEPRLLWPRLDMAAQLLTAAIQSKVTSIRNINQLSPITHPGPTRDAPALEEVAMRIELVGSAESATRFLKSIPATGDRLVALGFTGTVTNKPVFFIDKVLVRKFAPDRPGEVQLEARVCGFVPWPTGQNAGGAR